MVGQVLTQTKPDGRWPHARMGNNRVQVYKRAPDRSSAKI
jgi:hypothetical protein